MLSIAVSAVSLVVIVVVTVVLVNRSYQEESRRKAELRKVVDQVNVTQDSALAIENQQNTTIGAVNTSIDGLRKDVDGVRKDYVTKADLTKDVSTPMTALKSDVDGMKTSYVSKADLANEVASKQGKFGSLLVGDTGAISYDEASGMAFKVGESQVVGFDGNKMLVGSELAFSQDMAGDVYMNTVGENSRLIFQNGGAEGGMVIKGNKVGIGADPVFSDFDVSGSIAVRDNMYVGGGEQGPIRAFGMDKDGTFSIDPDKAYKGINVNNDVVFGGKVQINGELSFAAAADGQSTARFTDPHKIEFQAGTINNVPMSGPTMVIGEYGMDNATNSVVIGSRTYGTAYAERTITPMSLADNQFSNRSILVNDAGDGWTVMNNNNNDLAFLPSKTTYNGSSGDETGVLNIYKDGTLTAMGDGRFTGMVSAMGGVRSKGTIEGNSVCLSTESGPLCLEQDDLSYVKLLNAQNKSGTEFATKQDITTLNQQLTGLQDQLRAMGV